MELFEREMRRNMQTARLFFTEETSQASQDKQQLFEEALDGVDFDRKMAAPKEQAYAQRSVEALVKPQPAGCENAPAKPEPAGWDNAPVYKMQGFAQSSEEGLPENKGASGQAGSKITADFGRAALKRADEYQWPAEKAKRSMPDRASDYFRLFDMKQSAENRVDLTGSKTGSTAKSAAEHGKDLDKDFEGRQLSFFDRPSGLPFGVKTLAASELSDIMERESLRFARPL